MAIWQYGNMAISILSNCRNQEPMKLTLHIGTEKTGTTSIQKFLRLNDKTLRRRSIYTSTALGPNRCSKILVNKSSDKYCHEEKSLRGKLDTSTTLLTFF